jgi:hypothetical protein
MQRSAGTAGRIVYRERQGQAPPSVLSSRISAQIHAGYRSVTGTARLQGKSALQAVRELVEGKFAVA